VGLLPLSAADRACRRVAVVLSDRGTERQQSGGNRRVLPATAVSARGQGEHPVPADALRRLLRAGGRAAAGPARRAGRRRIRLSCRRPPDRDCLRLQIHLALLGRGIHVLPHTAAVRGENPVPPRQTPVRAGNLSLRDRNSARPRCGNAAAQPLLPRPRRPDRSHSGFPPRADLEGQGLHVASGIPVRVSPSA